MISISYLFEAEEKGYTKEEIMKISGASDEYLKSLSKKDRNEVVSPEEAKRILGRHYSNKYGTVGMIGGGTVGMIGGPAVAIHGALIGGMAGYGAAFIKARRKLKELEKNKE